MIFSQYISLSLSSFVPSLIVFLTLVISEPIHISLRFSTAELTSLPVLICSTVPHYLISTLIYTIYYLISSGFKPECFCAFTFEQKGSFQFGSFDQDNNLGQLISPKLARI